MAGAAASENSSYWRRFCAAELSVVKVDVSVVAPDTPVFVTGSAPVDVCAA